MKAHLSTLESRILRAASRVRLRYKIVAVGFDHRGRIIGLATNRTRLVNRGWHAEETLMYRSPRSLCRVVIARVNSKGAFLEAVRKLYAGVQEMVAAELDAMESLVRSCLEDKNAEFERLLVEGLASFIRSRHPDIGA